MPAAGSSANGEEYLVKRLEAWLAVRSENGTPCFRYTSQLMSGLKLQLMQAPHAQLVSRLDVVCEWRYRLGDMR